MKILTMLLFLIVASVSSISQEFGEPLYGSFKPLPGKKYIVSGWVKEDHPVQQLNYCKSFIRVSFVIDNAPVGPGYNFYPKGNIIDGWQRISGIIEIPSLLDGQPPEVIPAIELILVNESLAVDNYFDDIRFFPYNGNLKSFVYDEESQKLLAELDENNYATFYEYDNEGGLIRVKKETAKGIFTIQETRSHSSKSNEE